MQDQTESLGFNDPMDFYCASIAMRRASVQGAPNLSRIRSREQHHCMGRINNCSKSHSVENRDAPHYRSYYPGYRPGPGRMWLLLESMSQPVENSEDETVQGFSATLD